MSNGVCVIVGAGAGMGMALARRFGREGFLLALVSRNVDKLAAELDVLHDFDVHGFPADASDENALRSTFLNIHNQLAPPDVLIYNAAAIAIGEPSTLSAEAVLANFRVNVLGALVSAQQVIPHMKERQRGTILFTGGGLALYPSATYASLALGKAALRNLTGSLAQELTPHGIKVATVTIAGGVQPGTAFDPDRIADEYWTLHTSAPSRDEWEVVFRGA